MHATVVTLKVRVRAQSLFRIRMDIFFLFFYSVVGASTASQRSAAAQQQQQHRTLHTGPSPGCCLTQSGGAGGGVCVCVRGAGGLVFIQDPKHVNACCACFFPFLLRRHGAERGEAEPVEGVGGLYSVCVCFAFTPL